MCLVVNKNSQKIEIPSLKNAKIEMPIEQKLEIAHRVGSERVLASTLLKEIRSRKNAKHLKNNVSKNPKMEKSKQVSRSAFTKARQMRYAEGLWGTRRAPEHAQIYQQPEQEKYMCRNLS